MKKYKIKNGKNKKNTSSQYIEICCYYWETKTLKAFNLF